MAGFDKAKIEQTLKRVQERHVRYAKRQAEKELENVSPETIEAIKNLDRPNTHQSGGKDFMTMVEEYKAQHGCRLIDAIGAVSRMHPEAHEEYIRRANS